LFLDVRRLVPQKRRDYTVATAIDDVAADEAFALERVECLGKVGVIVRQDVELELVRLPLESSFSVSNAPKPLKRNP
jgi:hypothetical protein